MKNVYYLCKVKIKNGVKMEITVDIVREKFKEYNKKFFNNELIMPEIRLLKSYLTCGYFSCKKIIGKRKLKGQRLEISCYYD